MKYTTIIPAALAATSMSAFGYAVSFTNFPVSDNTAVPVLDNTGMPITGGAGYAAAGTFSSQPTSEDDISLFTAFGDGGSTFENDLVGTGTPVDGFFNNRRSEAIPFGSTDAPVGESIYIVLGNSTTLALSTQFAIIDVGTQFEADLQAGPNSSAFSLNDDFITEDNLIVGTIVTNVEYSDLGVTFNEGIQLGPAIPEPSTSLLAGLAGLCLAIRRRR